MTPHEWAQSIHDRIRSRIPIAEPWFPEITKAMEAERQHKARQAIIDRMKGPF